MLGALGAAALVLAAAPGASASTVTWESMTTQEQQGYLDGLMQVAGTPVSELPFQNGTSLGISDAFAAAESGQGAYGNAFASVVNELISGNTVSTADALVAEMRPFLEAGMTKVPPSVGASLSDTAFLEELLPVELDAAPETLGGSVVLGGAISLAGFLQTQIEGPPLTYTAGDLSNIAECSNNTTLAVLNEGGGGPCDTQTETNGPQFDQCTGSMLPEDNTGGGAVAHGGYSWTYNAQPPNLPADPDDGYGGCPGDGTGGADVAQTGTLGEWYVLEEDLKGTWVESGFTDSHCSTFNLIDTFGAPFIQIMDGNNLAMPPAWPCVNSQGVTIPDEAVSSFVEAPGDLHVVSQPSSAAVPAAVPVTDIPLCNNASATSAGSFPVYNCAGVAAAAPAALAGEIDSTTAVGAVMQGLVNSTVSAPAFVETPSCDGALYPEDYTTCAAQLTAAGLTPLRETATSGNCACANAGDLAGTVEGMSTSAAAYLEAGGVFVAPGSTVYVYAQDGYTAPPPTMPDCTGLTVGACEGAVAAVGSTATPSVTWQHAGSTTVGNVLSTVPAAGTVLSSPGEAVAIAGAGADVPPCDWGALYPEAFSTCETQMAAVGLTVVRIDAGDVGCGCLYTSDPPDTVEGLSTVPSPGYVEAGVATGTASKVSPPGGTLYAYTNPPATVTSVTMPDCTGMLVVDCEQALIEVGIPTPATVTWEPETPTVTRVGYLITQDPAGGAVVTNPSTATVHLTGAGLELPPPLPNELGPVYASRLEQAGFPTPIQETVPPALQDPSLQLGAVISISPGQADGVAADPANAPEETILENPPLDGLAEPIPPDPYTGPTIDPLGLEFPTVPTPCDVFPFGVPCWVKNQVEQLVTTSTPPAFTIPVPFFSTGLHVDLGSAFGVDTGIFMDVWRPTIGFATLVGIVVWLAGFALGGHSGHGGGGEGGDD